MKIVFTKHAEIKLEQRKISRSFVVKTLSNPDFIRPSYANRKVAYKNFGKNYFAVVFREENNEMIVITQHWIAKIKKK